jgi:glycosyltransferase involved in cell wall biosynthesis
VKIAWVSTILHFPWGGADTLWTHAAEAAQLRGDTLFISVSPAVAAHPRIAALVAAGAQRQLRRPPEFPLATRTRLRRKLGALAGSADALATALRRFRPDLVVFSFGGSYDFLIERPAFAWLQASRTPYRIIANWQSEHPVLGDEDRAASAGIMEGAEAVYFVSTRNLEVTRRHLLAALPRARVAQNPLRWRPTDVSPWPEGPEWSFATVSRLQHEKGVHLLLHAAAEALGGESAWRIDIFGQGPAEAELREITARLGLSARVRFRGHVPDLRAIWEGNQLMVSPAIDDGVPMTIPEAMLCHRPVLATRVGGAEDWIADGETGFLCDAPTLPLLAAALGRAWAARTRWRALGEAAAAAAARRYRADDFLQVIAPPARAAAVPS